MTAISSAVPLLHQPSTEVRSGGGSPKKALLLDLRITLSNSHERMNAIALMTTQSARNTRVRSPDLPGASTARSNRDFKSAPKALFRVGSLATRLSYKVQVSISNVPKGRDEGQIDL
jgi:hypothetical protein